MKNRHMSKKMDILALYTRDYSASFTGREISRAVGTSPQNALTILNGLVKDKIILFTKEGRNKKYVLNRKSVLAKQMIQIVETYKASFLLKESEFSLIMKGLIPFAETIIVFGSFAKGRQKESSDLDLIVIGGKKDDINKAKRVFPREINIEFSTWKGFAESLRRKNALAIEIRKDHLIYGNVFKVVEVYCQ
ncbi:MAG: nucleotidyltransferase domain-containing protein [archaeon]|nr:nucleotidyltransferase domain-containing protein [archaeon]